jgi:hypothetical protein
MDTNSPQSTRPEDTRNVQQARQELGPSKEAIARMSTRTQAILSGRSPLNRDVLARSGFDPRFEKRDGQYSSNRLSRNKETEISQPVSTSSSQALPPVPQASTSQAPASAPQSAQSTVAPAPPQPAPAPTSTLSSEQLKNYQLAWQYHNNPFARGRIRDAFGKLSPEDQRKFREYAKLQRHDWSGILPENFINNCSNSKHNRRMEANDVRNIMEAYGSIYNSEPEPEYLDEKLRERPRGLPYGPVGKGFKKLTIAQRAKMIERGKQHTRKAMNSGEEYSGSHAASSAINSALLNPRLKECIVYILEHLITEGYAEDLDSAVVMLENMSEEWATQILSETAMPTKVFSEGDNTATDSRTVPFLKHTTNKPLNIPISNRVAATLKRILNLPSSER